VSTIPACPTIGRDADDMRVVGLARIWGQSRVSPIETRQPNSVADTEEQHRVSDRVGVSLDMAHTAHMCLFGLEEACVSDFGGATVLVALRR